MTSLEKPVVSLVIPAYNEEDNIVEAIERTDLVMRDVGVEYEIIVVNDGSSDETGLKAFDCARNNGHVKVISYDENKGKGYAVRTGFFSAVGDLVVFVDSDLEVDPVQIRGYVEALEAGDVIVGSKKHPESRVEVPLSRRFLSWGFNSMVKMFTGLKLSDTQSGLKAVRKKSLEKVFRVLSVKRFAFDVELLTVADLYGLSIVELPVNIRLENSFFSPKEIFKMFIDLLRITYRLRVIRWYQCALNY